MTYSPECPWRPARWLVTDFITPDNPAIKEQAEQLRKLSQSDDDYIKLCAVFIRDNFVYPLDRAGNPSAGLLWRRYDKGTCIPKYFYNQTLDYAWGFPCETIKIKKGICIDTALLMTSLLIAGGVPSRCALGAVMNRETDTVAGYHAWSTFMYKGEKCADETTIHFQTETITRINSLYNKFSDWVMTNGIYYRQDADFDKGLYEATTDTGEVVVSLMGLPPAQVECYGLQETLEMLGKRHKAMVKEWRRAEMTKHKILSLAYGGG